MITITMTLFLEKLNGNTDTLSSSIQFKIEWLDYRQLQD